MAKGFELLISDAFAELYTGVIMSHEKMKRMVQFAGLNHPLTYPGIKDKYSDLTLTPFDDLVGAYRQVPRELFVHPYFRPFANSDTMLPIWHPPEMAEKAEKTIQVVRSGSMGYQDGLNALLTGSGEKFINTSEPHLILTMLALANIGRESAVLEIGSGCGYVLALASLIAQNGNVHGLEKNEALAAFSQKLLQRAENVTIYQGDALKELPPPNSADGYDAIIASAGTTAQMAGQFVKRLKVGGRMVVPIQCGTPEEIAKGCCSLTVHVRNNADSAVTQPEAPDTIFTTLK
ncbi:hypothetical protein HYV85_04960 [Candidatus Woesearchaeota archaeon]|nr:hypothetical protein [Candidatus Woesearchaeota archaeon]